jgi:tRNA (cytidine/uridine-2'-O-)-methyltransferase
MSDSIELRPHALNLVLMQPQIAPNTGNIGRLCVATGTRLHLVRPLGFVLSDRNLRRSGMDYWPRLQLTLHDDDTAFERATAGAAGQRWYFTSKGTQAHWSASFSAGDWLVFGSETSGLPEAILTKQSEQCLRIPQIAGERCLNLATAAGVGLFEAIRQIQRPGTNLT